MTEDKKPKRKTVNKVFSIRFLIIVWIAVLVALVVAFIVAQTLGDRIQSTTFPLLSTITAFAAFITQSIFSFAIIRYNAINRNLNEEMKKTGDDINARSEAFREMQFIAANYTVIDFVDSMLIYEESERYIKKLLRARDFSFYLKEDGIDETDIFENFNDYAFVSVRIPIKLIEGKTIGAIRFSRFKFTTEEMGHIFVPCANCDAADCLILHNEITGMDEAVVNLIAKASSDFFIPGAVLPFLSMKIDSVMQSLLGVEIKGKTQLYFTNPEKLEKSGANKYKINSSHFVIIGKPALLENTDNT